MNESSLSSEGTKDILRRIDANVKSLEVIVATGFRTIGMQLAEQRRRLDQQQQSLDKILRILGNEFGETTIGFDIVPDTLASPGSAFNLTNALAQTAGAIRTKENSSVPGPTNFALTVGQSAGYSTGNPVDASGNPTGASLAVTGLVIADPSIVTAVADGPNHFTVTALAPGFTDVEVDDSATEADGRVNPVAKHVTFIVSAAPPPPVVTTDFDVIPDAPTGGFRGPLRVAGMRR